MSLSSSLQGIVLLHSIDKKTIATAFESLEYPSVASFSLYGAGKLLIAWYDTSVFRRGVYVFWTFEARIVIIGNSDTTKIF